MLRLLLSALLVLVPLEGARAGAPSKGAVVVFSLDGLAANQFSAKTMPRVWKLARRGFSGEALPPFPATTFNGHATLATGCWPEHHGVVSNYFRSPGEGKLAYAATARVLQREPLWVAATRSGVKTAVFSWPCADLAWEGVAPARLHPFKKPQDDLKALEFASRSLAEGCGLVMVYLSGTDSEGHHFGPASPEVRRKLASLDGLLARWLHRALGRHRDLRVVLTGDHGMAEMQHRIPLNPLLGDLKPGLATHGGSAYVYLEDPQARREAMSRLRAEKVMVWERADLPERFHLAGSPRVGDLVLLAPLGTWLGHEGDAEEAEGRVGAHAYGWDEPSMHIWLVVLGAGRGRLGEVPLWDLAPTIAEWLGIHWARDPDGHAVPGLVGR